MPRADRVQSAPHRCPRCDYDLSGETSRWEAACPIVGRCPECGLDFAWGDVLNPDRRIVPGFVEHAEGRWGVFRAAWRTWWWVAQPWSFWRRVNMHHRVVPARALLWVAIILLPAHLVRAAASLGCWTINFASALPLYPDVVLQTLSSLVWPLFSVRTYSGGGPGVQFVSDRHAYVLWAVGAMTLAWPLLLLCLPWTRARAKVHARHIWRATCYSAWWLVFVWVLAAVREVLELGNTLVTGPGLRRGFVWDMYDAVKDFIRDALRAPGYVFLFGIAWLSVWWLFAITRGFRLTRAVFVWALLMVTVALWGVAAWVVMGAARAFYWW